MKDKGSTEMVKNNKLENISESNAGSQGSTSQHNIGQICLKYAKMDPQYNMIQVLEKL